MDRNSQAEMLASTWLERAANGARAAGITAAREGKGTSLRAPALLLVDVGGLSGANGTLDALALIRMLCAVFHASLRALVIKSSCMRTLARQLRQLRPRSRRGVKEREVAKWRPRRPRQTARARSRKRTRKRQRRPEGRPARKRCDDTFASSDLPST